MSAPRLAVVEPGPSHVVALHRLILQREALRPSFFEAFSVVEGFTHETLERWCSAALALQNINAGLGCSIAFFTLTSRLGRRSDIDTAILAAQTAEVICRRAGSRAAAAALESIEGLKAIAGSETNAILASLSDLAAKRPEAVACAIPALPAVITVIGPAAYAEWLAAGLRAYAIDRAKLCAYVGLEDALARERLRDYGRAGALRRAMPAAIAFAASLNGEKPALRFVAAAVRASFASPIVVMPESFADFSADRQGDLVAAALAHVAAHRIFGSAIRFNPKGLKPVQLVLTSLFEDARVEVLAMRRWPGLARLWRPYHVASPGTARTVPSLMARMARALFDQDYDDPEDWIAKARSMFVAAAQSRLEDPAVSREIGNLLGNDLGQMRLSFNLKSYVVEPAYRDDHAGLWAMEQPPDSQATEIDVAVEAVRRTEEERDDGTKREDETRDSASQTGRARTVQVSPGDGIVLAKLPEWDHAAALERPDWVTVKAYRPVATADHAAERLWVAAGALAAKVEAMVKRARLGLPQRLKRQGEGDNLDLDQAIAAAIARRIGATPDHRVYRRSDRSLRDATTLLLVDTSESTRDRPAGRRTRILDEEIIAAAVLARAADALGDRLAVEGFSSDGRNDVRVTAVKDFRERFEGAAVARLAGLAPGYSTRLGAALRHGGRRFAQERAYRRLLIVVTDGEPFDVDCDDPVYLVEDGRRAVKELRAAGIDAFGLGIGASFASGVRIFGRGNFVLVTRPDDLPKALAALYFRLSAR
jgi:nitric oxide reductase NorD protein